MASDDTLKLCGAFLAGAGALWAFTKYSGGDTAASPLQLIVFGAPGSGKGTQCAKLKASFGLRHISTGDVLRDHVKRGTPLGKEAQVFMDSGQLVPDDLMLGLIKTETDGAAETGWLIDGMPRTRNQAEHMQRMGLLGQLFVTLEVPDAALEERITLRRLDPDTGDIYHLKVGGRPAPRARFHPYNWVIVCSDAFCFCLICFPTALFLFLSCPPSSNRPPAKKSPRG